MRALLLIALLTAFTFSSCDTFFPECDCTEEWKRNEWYERGDVVKYNNACWEANSKNRFTRPDSYYYDEAAPVVWTRCY